VICCHREQGNGGHFKEGTYSNGQSYYLHRYDPKTGELKVFTSCHYSGSKPNWMLAMYDEAYRTLLELLPLSQQHRADLRRRGLTDEQIDERLYKTLPASCRDRAKVVTRLCKRILYNHHFCDHHGNASADTQQALRNDLLLVPGFILRGEVLTITGAAGMLIAV
jgi:hypothetical protein